MSGCSSLGAVGTNECEQPPRSRRVGVDDEHDAVRGLEITTIVGDRFLAPPDRVDLGVRGVHAAVDIDVATVPVALVVHRPARVALVRPIGDHLEVLARAAPELVGPRPALTAGQSVIAMWPGWAATRSSHARMAG